MVNRVPPSRATELATWGTIEIPTTLVGQKTQVQNAPAIRQGPEGQRGDQQGAVKMKISDLSGGGFKRIGDWTRDGNRYAYNEGLMTHIPGGLYLPYLLTSQTSLTAVDVSGYRAANLRVHSCITDLGTSSLRYIAAIGPYIHTDTSSSNPALVGAGGLTNNIECIQVVIKNNVRYVVMGTSGTTNDITWFDDPFDNIASNGTYLAYIDAADSFWGIETFPNIGSGFNAFYGRYNAVNGIFFDRYVDSLATAVEPVAFSDTSSNPNPSNSVTSVTKTVGTIYHDGTDLALGVWVNPINMVTSDNVYATRALGAGVTVAMRPTYLTNWGLNLPDGAIVTGLAFSVEGKVSNAAGGDVANVSAVYVVKNGSKVAASNQGASAAWTTSDAVYTFGSSTNTWTDLSADDVNDPGFGIDLEITQTTVTGTITLSVDAVSLVIYYRVPGVGISLPIGGFSVGKFPGNPSRWAVVAPPTNELVTCTLPRALYYIDFEHQVQGDRLLGTISQPFTGLSHVEAACFYSGGIAVAGDTSSGVGKSVKLIEANGTVRDLGFLSQDGFTSPVGVVNMFAAGRVLICEVAWEDGSNSQWWYFFDATWHFSTPLQTKSSTISGIPLAWAESFININQQYRYRFFPRSGALACAREFQPRNIFEDPLVNNTTITKQNGPLFVRLPELNLGGPEEANKVVLGIDYVGRLASATGGSYGTVLFEMDTGGDTAFSSVEVTNLFDSEFETYNVPTSGVAFRTIIPRITLNNAASSTKTPNGLPFVITMSVTWPILYTYQLYFDWEALNERYSHITEFLAEVETLNNTKAVQQFNWGVVDVPAVFEGMETLIIPPPFGSPPQELSGKPFLVFRQVRGTTA